MSQADQIRQYVRENFDEVPSRSQGDELTFICRQPGCHDQSGNRSVNLKTGLTSCWRCARGGPFVSWVRQLGMEIDLEDVEPRAVTADEIDELIESISDVGRVVKPSGYIPEVPLPRGFTPLGPEPVGAYERLIAKMAARKRLEYADLHAAGVGYTRIDRRWEPFAIFPVYEWGRPVYYQGRTYVDTPGESTKKFPNRDECPLSSKFWIYNLDELRRVGGIIIVVESILNVLSLTKELRRRGLVGVVPVAVFKHKVSAPQHAKLVQVIRQATETGHPVTEVSFMYDDDATAVAYRDAELFVNTLATSVVEMPVGVDANDDASQAVDLFLVRRPYDRLRALEL